MDIGDMGRIITIFGIAITGIGILIWLTGRIPALGELPGTIRLEIGRATCVFPVMASVILSVILTILINLAFRIIK